MEHREEETLLIIGSGVLAGNVLDLLSWHGYSGQITVASRNEKTLIERTNLSRISAYNQGQYPRITTTRLDLNDVDRCTEVIAGLRPDIIFNTASIQTYWRISTLPKENYETLARIGVGAWLPMHLSPALRLMTAVRASGLAPVVVNGAYPDGVNPVLATRGLAPTLGIGNIMNVVPAVRAAISMVLAEPVEDIQIRFVAHHFVSNLLPAAGDTGGAPICLRIYAHGHDVTEQVDLPEMFRLLPTKVRRTRGSAGMYVTASSALAVLFALRSAAPVPLHAPGPGGLPGGYPVVVSASGVELDLPDSCPADTAIRINEQSQVYDGLERIEPDGRVVLSDVAVKTLKDELGYYCPEFKVEECHEWAAELKDKYRSFEASLTSVTNS